MTKKYIRFLPAVIWMGVIYYFSASTTTGVPLTGWWRFLVFKSFHLIEYAILAVLLWWPLGKTTPTLMISYLYAVFDEIHQRFTVGRGSKFSDTIIDLTGIVAGLLLIKLASAIYRKIFYKENYF